MKKVLLLSTATANSLPGLWCLRKAGYSTVVVGNLSKNKSLRTSLLCKKFYAIPEAYTFESNSAEILSHIREIALKEDIDIVVPSGFDSVKFLSFYKDELGNTAKILSVPDPAAIEGLGNKYKFSLFCKENNIPHPYTQLLENLEQLSDGVLKLNFPMVIKPLDLAGSKGVKKVKDKSELIEYLSLEQDDKSNALPILLQEVIPGAEASFNAFATDGKINAWTIQNYIEMPLNDNMSFRWLQFSDNHAIFDIGEKIIRISNYTGSVCMDMRIDSNNSSIKVIEVNPRFWATTLCSLCDGVNFIDAAIKSTFDFRYKVNPRCSNRLWGNFWKIPILAVKKRDIKILRYLPRFSIVQVKYIVESLFLKVLSCVQGLIPGKGGI